MRSVSANKASQLPLKVFEVGDVFQKVRHFFFLVFILLFFIIISWFLLIFSPKGSYHGYWCLEQTLDCWALLCHCLLFRGIPRYSLTSHLSSLLPLFRLLVSPRPPRLLLLLLSAPPPRLLLPSSHSHLLLFFFFFSFQTIHGLVDRIMQVLRVANKKTDKDGYEIKESTGMWEEVRRGEKRWEEMGRDERRWEEIRGRVRGDERVGEREQRRFGRFVELMGHKYLKKKKKQEKANNINTMIQIQHSSKDDEWMCWWEERR